MEFSELVELDRSVLQRCLERKPRAWEDFVDRFIGLVTHVVDHASRSRGVRLREEDRNAFCTHVFHRLAEDDFELLRRFRGRSTLASYLTVVARRVVVQQLIDRVSSGSAREAASQNIGTDRHVIEPAHDEPLRGYHAPVQSPFDQNNSCD